MKNYVQPGKVINVIAPAAKTSGDGVLVGRLFGVATKDAGSGAELPIIVEGVVSLPKLSTDVVTIGAVLYWDNTNSRLTLVVTSNFPVGLAVSAAGNGVTTVWVKLIPGTAAAGAP